MQRKRRYAGVVNLPAALPVVPEALGLRARVRVGGAVVELAWPILAAGEENGRPLLAPADAHSAAPLDSRLQDAYSGAWGYVSSSRVAYIDAFAVSVILPPAPDLASSEELLKLARHFDDWLETVRLWGSAWIGAPLVAGGGRYSSTLHLADKAHLIGSGTFMNRGIERSGPVLFLQLGLDEAQSRGALRRASNGEPPPLPVVLLTSAQEAAWSGDRRQVVIDAATAVEVALANRVRHCLTSRGVPGSFAEAAILQANGVVGLLTLLQGLGEAAPISKGKLADQIAKPRNEAAHAGVIPSRATADTVRSHAWAIVKSVVQLPRC